MKAKGLFFIVGPTAVGKSDLAAQAAHRSGGIVLNADSVQNYQEVMIGAAKPGPELRSLAPHRLFDWVTAGEELTAAQYRREALSVIEREIRQHPVFVVGGSGFYIRALENGMYPVPEVPSGIKAQVLAELSEWKVPLWFTGKVVLELEHGFGPLPECGGWCCSR